MQIELVRALFQNDISYFSDLGGGEYTDLNFDINEDGLFPLQIVCIKG